MKVAVLIGQNLRTFYVYFQCTRPILIDFDKGDSSALQLQIFAQGFSGKVDALNIFLHKIFVPQYSVVTFKRYRLIID